MESRMNEVGNTAIRIGEIHKCIRSISYSFLSAGEQLESVHTERQRAQAAHDLIDYYGQFSRGDTTRLDALKKDGREGRRQVAILLRRLTTVAREVDLPTAETVRFSNRFVCSFIAE
jgi:exocyst complex component 5